MIRPFVLITPEAEREALRNSGVLPECFFRVFDVNSNGLRKDSDDERPSLYFWPYDLKYAEVVDRTEDGLFKPDVPSFFGLKTPLNDAEKRHNERLITGLLSSVMVHVVFLDSRRGQNGYAAFKSFEEVVKWGRSLRRALNVRFRNEDVLQSMESVLVIVARGEQVTLRNSDIQRFNDCVQRWRGDVFSSERDEDGKPLRKVFQSCYFLDYNLCVRDSRELYHSAEVWDVVVGRLLLSFLLARNGKMRWWQIPGVKLWRSLACTMDIDAASDRKVIDEALTRANAKLQDYAARSEDLDELALLHRDPEKEEPISDILLEPEDAGHTLWRNEPAGGWSDFDAQTCAKKSAEDSNGSRWRSGFEKIAHAFRCWKIERNKAEDEEGVRDLFKAIRRSPGNLLKATEVIYAKLSKEGAAAGCESGEKWKDIVRTELVRRKAVEQIEKNAPELAEAQKHYVGLGMSAMAVVAVSLALGSAGYYLIHCLNGFFRFDLPVWVIALAMFTLFAVGSICAATLMLGCHLHAGRRAVAELCKESENIDGLMVQRDRKTRELVAQGLLMRTRLHLQGIRFRSWALLKRTQDILATELQPMLSKKYDGVRKSVDTGEVKNEHNSVHDTFLLRTSHMFGPYRITFKEDLRIALEREIASWWSAQASYDSTSTMPRNFFELWNGLCANDVESAGYFPARTFSDGIRDFVARFSDAVRLSVKMNVLQDHKIEVRSGILKWYEDLQRSEYYLYASGAVTGEHVNENLLENARVYLSSNEAVDIDRINALHRGSQADQSRFVPEICPELNLTRHLTLLFQEIKIQFCCDAKGDEYGHLTFKEVADVIGGTNG